MYIILPEGVGGGGTEVLIQLYLVGEVGTELIIGAAEGGSCSGGSVGESGLS
jgi:hypothetical protein